jgi:heterodisulfide reductase subunit C
MRYIAAAQRGDIAKVADLSFDCLMCGLCASRCPAEIVQYNVAILARRLYARHLVHPAAHLAVRVQEIESGVCEADLDAMVAASDVELKRLYAAREIEAEES